MTQDTPSPALPAIEARREDGPSRPEAIAPPGGGRFRRILLPACLALVVAADVMFYGRTVGSSLAVFLSLLSIATAALHRPAKTLVLVQAGSALAVCLVPSVLGTGGLQSAFACLGAVLFALILSGRARSLHELPLDLVAFASAFLSRPGRRAVLADPGPRIERASFLPAAARWAVPVLSVAVFLALFSAANPLITATLRFLDPLRLLRIATPFRVFFWLLAFASLFAFLSARTVAPSPASPSGPAARRPPRLLEMFVNGASVFRSLILFNVLFAFQTATDAGYLAGGIALPEGTTYADYVHRGAYALAAAALLSAGFSLLALRRGVASYRRRTIDGLLILWLAQNVLLVLSAMLRLDLYVAAYSLTELRLLAFAWMGLVAAGLVLILARIVFHRSAAWLFAGNLAAVLLAAYALAVFDIKTTVARYNVERALGSEDPLVGLDANYLCSLGQPAFVPVVRRLQSPIADAYGGYQLRDCARRLAQTVLEDASDWRSWTVSDALAVPAARGILERGDDNGL